MTAMHVITRSVLLLALALPAASSSLAGEGPVTRYGDYCKDCTLYGVCKEPIPPREAIHALSKYYEERGYRVGIVSHKGRFIEAEIFQGNKQVDKVIFDRKTGRVRSMY
jgi:hypothetical protein